MFVIGDVKVLPNLRQSFKSDRPVGLYFQVYNAGIDQTSLQPSLTISFRLIKDGKVIRQMTDRTGQSIQFFSDQRVVVMQALGLEGLEESKYMIRIQVNDEITNQSLELNVPFYLSS
jgi:hypothetical protein